MRPHIPTLAAQGALSPHRAHPGWWHCWGAFPRLWHRSRRHHPPPPLPPTPPRVPHPSGGSESLSNPHPTAACGAAGTAALPAAGTRVHARACSLLPSCILHRGVAFFTGAACILHRGGGSCVFHQGCFRFAPVGGCISHQRCFHFALEGAVAFSTWDACFLHQWCCPFCTGGSRCILHQEHLHFIPVGFAFCTRDACFLHW